MVEIIPVYASEADINDPRQFAAWALGQWPKVEKSQPYPPAPRPMLPYHSQFLWDLGFRFHPELATVVKVAGKSGWPEFMSHEEAEALKEEAPTKEQVEAEVLNLLDQVNPGMAAELDALSPEDKAVKAKELQEGLSASIEALQKLQEHLGEQ